MTTLRDTVRIEAPKKSPIRPVSPLDSSWDNASESRSSERSFKVGYHSASLTQWDRLALGRGQALWRKAA